jgi:hypothetical protein
MARHQGHVGVYRAAIPLGAPIEELPPVRNFIDELVFARLKTLGMPPSSLSDDATFVRRVSIDIAGRLPTPDEVRDFVANSDPAKRDRLIDALVLDGGYADYFANKWSAILRNKRPMASYIRGSYAFHWWIRQCLHENMPYDQFVRHIVAASGHVTTSPAVAWYREVKTVDQQVENSAQLFLGMRLQCARCHHHPYEKWSQQDYYGFAAFFSRLGVKTGELLGEERIYHMSGVAAAENPKTKKLVPPTGLESEPLQISAQDDPREALADWMVASENPYFAPALVNRYWRHFFSRGLVDPEDDMRVTNPASNPELLKALSRHFIDTGFDLKDLVRTICQSSTYQLSSAPNQHNGADKQSFSRYYPRRLTAEVLLDALDDVAGSASEFPGLPKGIRAMQLPDNGSAGDGGISYFLGVFGKPEANTACECERSQETTLAQILHLLNSSEVHAKLSSSEGRAAALAAESNRSNADKLGDIYLLAYARLPSSDELERALPHIEGKGGNQEAYEDVIWTLVNSKEFLFNH